MREVILYPGEDGYWVVECPSLPGCISQWKTKREAISCYTHAPGEDNPPATSQLKGS